MACACDASGSTPSTGRRLRGALGARAGRSCDGPEASAIPAAPADRCSAWADSWFAGASSDACVSGCEESSADCSGSPAALVSVSVRSPSLRSRRPPRRRRRRRRSAASPDSTVSSEPAMRASLSSTAESSVTRAAPDTVELRPAIAPVAAATVAPVAAPSLSSTGPSVLKARRGGRSSRGARGSRGGRPSWLGRASARGARSSLDSEPSRGSALGRS